MTSRRDILEDLRRQLLDATAVAEVKELAALSRELRQVVAELDGLASPDAVTPADEIAQRREERRRKAAGA